MLRYIAFVWNEIDPTLEKVSTELQANFASAHTWPKCFEAPGIAVYMRTAGPTAERAYPLGAQNGVVLGRIFPKIAASDASLLDPSLDLDQTDRIVQSAGRALISDFWGRYVGFIRDQGTRKKWVVRDPTGQILCNSTRFRGVDLYFCRLADCLTIRSGQFTVNLHYLTGFLLFNLLATNETGLNEVTEVLAGECVEHDSDRLTRRFLWNPLEIAQKEPFDSPDDATIETRKVVRRCVHAWASCADGIVHHLSGGLDSSIVALCLADSPARLRTSCLTYYTNYANDDERWYARLAAEKAGLALIERQRNAAFRMDPILSMPPTAFPCYGMSSLESKEADRLLLRELGATAMCYGIGGDWLFYCGFGSMPTFADIAYRYGLRGLTLARLLDSAQLDNRSIWQIIRMTAVYGLRRRQVRLHEPTAIDYRPTMSRDLKQSLAADPTLIHPLYRHVSGIPPAKLMHAYMITCGTSPHHNPFEQEDDPIDLIPLCSQPIMELSLRIPTYVLAAGGRDRAVARAAFAADLPPEILNRKTKGSADLHVHEMLAENATLVRELLLDGRLAREGYIDRSAIEEVLADRPTEARAFNEELYTYLGVEAWCRQWTMAA